MASKQHEKQAAVREAQERERLTAMIGQHVILALGQPSAYHRVQVRPLWDDRYRVNVLVGPDSSSARVAHSFFLVADGEGRISNSNPEIRKRY